MGKRNSLRTTIHTMYKDWKDPDLKPLVSKDQFDLVLSTLNHYIAKTLIVDAGMVAIPRRLGLLGVMRFKNADNPIPRFDVMHQTGAAVPHRNWHSGGWYAKIVWTKTKTYLPIVTRAAWRFRPYRGNKKWLSTEIIENNSILNYLEG